MDQAYNLLSLISWPNSNCSHVKVILCFLPLFITLGCKQSESRKVYYTFPNGQAGQVRYYDNPDDSLTHRKEVFYSNGAKGYVGKFANGKKNGVWIWWYSNGNKKDQCKYADGFEVDTIYHWYKNGIIQQIEIIGEGKRGADSCICNGTA
jgi:antitoxin component YwqK of YwqJK toxin-antitoxin module